MTLPNDSGVRELPYGVEGPATLRTGEVVVVRVLGLQDRRALETFLEGLSEESRVTRFFSAVRPPSVVERMLAPAGFHQHLGLVIVEPDRPQGPILSHAEYARDPFDAPSAEVAFLTADVFQARGCATILLKRLALAAVHFGMTTFHAEVLAANDRMRAVLRNSGFPFETHVTEEGLSVSLRIDRPPPTERETRSSKPESS